MPTRPFNILLITTDEERSAIPRPDGFRLPSHERMAERGTTFSRYFSPLEPNRPSGVDQLFASNDVVLYDRANDPEELVNRAHDADCAELVEVLSAKLEALISAEIGADDRAWVTERPQLLGWPTWRGDARSTVHDQGGV